MGSVEVKSYIFQVKNVTDGAMNKALMAVGEAVKGHAKELCPVDTGAMRNSITFAIDNPFGKEEITVSVGTKSVNEGTNIYYAPYVELGHHQQPGRYVPAIGKRLVRDFVPAKPFLRPAFENNMEEIKGIIQAELGNI